MKQLPIGIQTFEDIRKMDAVYVDKTKFVWQLSQQGRYYFLSRPRRFGKSLFLTTLKSYFEGKRMLFEGLYIFETEKHWEKHPVIHLDFSLVTYNNGRAVFEASLLVRLQQLADSFGISLENSIVGSAFTELVIKLEQKIGKVVILVDEYDKALVDTLADSIAYEENKEVLRNLYGAIKGLDAHLRFVLLTGVSRFSKVSVFSGLNNLQDISIDENYGEIVGFTQAELLDTFKKHIEFLNAQRFQVAEEVLLQDIKFWYNGYSFSGKEKIYNPFSILSLFSNQDFGNFWFSTGTPTFLLDLIKKQKHLPETYENLRVSDLTGSSNQMKNLPILPLLYQTGYLTIHKIERDGVLKYYYLDYPNEEVRQSFLTYLAASFLEKDEFEVQPDVIVLRKALQDGDTDLFIERFQAYLADIPSRLHIPKEAYYHSLAYMMLRMIGVKAILEKETNKGRIDAVLEFSDKIYILEFKFATTKRIKRVKTLSKNALKQIEDKKYYQPYLETGKKVILFGIGFLDKTLDGRIKIL